jgi:hypothetical protein
VASREKTQACSSFEERPLVTRKPFFPMRPQSFVPSVPLSKMSFTSTRQAQPLFLPSPLGRIEGFPPLSPAGISTAPQNVSDRVGREDQAFLLPQVPGKPFPSITCAFSRFPDLGFDFPWGFGKGRNAAAGLVLKPGKSLFLEAADPLADQVTRGMPPSGCLGDAPASKVGLHQLHPRSGFMA